MCLTKVHHFMAFFLFRSRHNTVWYFRRRIPRDISNLFQHQLIYFSLKTSCRQQARILARSIASQTDQLFLLIRNELQMKRTHATGFIFELTVQPDGTRQVLLRSEPSDTPEQLTAVLPLIHLAQAESTQPKKPSTSTNAGPTIAELISAFEKSQKYEELAPNTRREYSRAFQDLLKAIPPSLPIPDFDREHVECFIKSKPGTAPSTINKHISAIQGLFAWATRDMHFKKCTPSVDFGALRKPKKTAAQNERDALSLEELEGMFSLLVATDADGRGARKSREQAYWATLLTAATGARISELAQMDVFQDIKHTKNSEWHLYIRATADDELSAKNSSQTQITPSKDSAERKLSPPHVKQLKTLASERVIPVHSSLISLGFIDYLERIRLTGSRTLFPAFPPYLDEKFGAIRYAHALISWGTSQKNRLEKLGKWSGDNSKKSYFHSLRHTVATTLAENDVQIRTIAKLLGHDQSSNDSTKRYAKTTVTKIRQALEKHLTPITSLFPRLPDELKDS